MLQAAVQDAETGAVWLLERYPNARLIICGFSFGGPSMWAALDRLAAKYGPRLAGAASIAGSCRGGDTYEELRLATAACVERFAGRVLFLHGAADKNVALQVGEFLHARAVARGESSLVVADRVEIASTPRLRGSAGRRSSTTRRTCSTRAETSRSASCGIGSSREPLPRRRTPWRTRPLRRRTRPLPRRPTPWRTPPASSTARASAASLGGPGARGRVDDDCEKSTRRPGTRSADLSATQSKLCICL